MSDKSEKKEINYYLTMDGLIERHEHLEKLKKRRAQAAKKKEENPEIISGRELLYRILERENIKVLNKVQRDLKDYLQPDANLAGLLRPPYLVPEIISHKLERTYNDF